MSVNLKDCLMFKMSHAGENHSDTVFVRSIDRLLVSDRSSRLYDSCNTCLVSSFYTIEKGKKASDAITLPAIRSLP